MTHAQYVFYAQILRTLVGPGVTSDRVHAYFAFIEFTEIGFEPHKLVHEFQALPGELPRGLPFVLRRSAPEEALPIDRGEIERLPNVRSPKLRIIPKTSPAVVGNVRVIRFNSKTLPKGEDEPDDSD